ncbi:hypothetical protein CDAR_305001 [Caerostris darwini]|uniref:Replication protein n=1 Tax=Caerostris darwini TaxID=1538125 RepID=A0AAV4URV6_9ARAC|nr:hypothetical protein CDAR_305001 [Caerostris darwini]
MEQQYRGYFVTIASKDGVPHPIAVKICDILELNCDEIDYVIEPHKSGLPHMHIMLYYKKELRKSDLKRKVQNTVYKFISRPLVVKEKMVIKQSLVLDVLLELQASEISLLEYDTKIGLLQRRMQLLNSS